MEPLCENCHHLKHDPGNCIGSATLPGGECGCDTRDLVKCTITFYYNRETWDNEWMRDDEAPLPDERVLDYCKALMIEDVTNFTDPITTESVSAEFVDSTDGWIPDEAL